MKKTILTVLGTILLGAIGSGIWDWVLADALALAGNAVLKLFSAAFGGYLNVLYKEVGKGALYPMIMSLFTMFFMLILLFPALAVLIVNFKIKQIVKQKSKSNDEKKNFDEKLYKVTKMFKFRLLPLCGIVVVIITLQIWQVVYSNSASSFIERSIDIISPYVSEAERKTIISEYRMISNADDFYKIENKLLKLASKNSLKLPKFSSI